VDGGRAAGAAYRTADNMTEEVGALSALLDIGQGQEELGLFAARWSGDRNVMDKWFALQIMLAHPDRAAGVTESLSRHPDFDWKNPNRFRSVIGALVSEPCGVPPPSRARDIAWWRTG
jgi:aminopeptidase N